MGRYHRLLDGSPRNIDRGIVVRIQAETALLTAKGGLGLTIGFFTMSTLRAGATGVPWVNELERNARPSCLVGNASSQVEKSPAMPFIAVFPTNRDSLSNAAEVFKRVILSCQQREAIHEAASLKRCCVSCKTASWLAMSSLIQMVLVRVLLIKRV